MYQQNSVFSGMSKEKYVPSSLKVSIEINNNKTDKSQVSPSFLNMILMSRENSQLAYWIDFKIE